MRDKRIEPTRDAAAEKPARRRFLFPFLFVIALLAVLTTAAWLRFNPRQPGSAFDGQRAYAAVEYQVSLGPRTPGSPAHGRFIEWAIEQLRAAGWSVAVHETTRLGQPIKNIVAKRGIGESRLLLGAHYDSRLLADQDPDPARRVEPVPGANDGASGVAVLLELARALPPDLDKEVWLVFFDAEDNGDIAGWEWILGSRVFVENLAEPPDAAIIVDMVGDGDLNIYMERNSDPTLTTLIWAQAALLGHADKFIPAPKYAMIDDHTPFLKAGIPAVDIIDFDYPFWHTTEDTPDKVSAESLEVVGDTLYAWLVDEPR